jgi:retron-type reverse transcriptase
LTESAGETVEPTFVPGVAVLNSFVRKIHSLTGRIDMRLMRQAFKAVKKNRGAAGIDKVSIKMFERNLDQNLEALMKRLKNGTFSPFPLRRKYIPKDRKRFRPLGIPAVRDRVAQEVVRRLIEPYFEPFFSIWSFGFRPLRNCHQADIMGFFDNIPHKLIMRLLAVKIADGNILSLIWKFLKSGVMEDGVFHKTTKGTPQGGVISPLLANIVLDVLDRELVNNGYVFVRYADDFLVLAKSASVLEKAYSLVQEVIQLKLGLQLSVEKTRLTTFSQGFDFLGFHFSHKWIIIRTKALEKMKDKIRSMTIRSHNCSEALIKKINRVTRGYANYYATDFSNVKQQFKTLDEFIRRRLRCMKTKRITQFNNRKIPNRFFERRGLFALHSVVQNS